jgi:hypothetical protein
MIVARAAAESPRSPTALRRAALAGGAVASASLATSATIATALTARDVDDATALRMTRTAFAAGGPVHGVAFGVLTAALAASQSARLPRWVVNTGFVSAASGIASPAYFAWEQAGWLIPGGRFPGLVVAAVAGRYLAGRR